MMDDQFEERLVYSSDSDDIEADTTDAIAPVASPQTLDKRIDDVLAEVQRRPSIDDDELIFSSKSRNSKKILSSDEDSDAAAVPSESNEGKEKSDKSDIDESEATARDGSEEKLPAPVRSTLWDSDSSSGDVRANEVPVPKTKKKVLKKKKKDTKKRVVEREGSDSDSSDASDDAKRQKKSKSNAKSSESSSDSTDEEATSNDNIPLPPREKGIQRMSAKAAVENIKEIQSESQRLARQLYINVPYHKPKQHSLKEFLGRRCLTKQHELVARMPTKSTAAAIKMSAEELQIYAESLEQRAQEAIEFFQNEDDEPTHQQSSNESDDGETKKETKPSEKPPEKSSEKPSEEPSEQPLEKPEETVEATESLAVIENLEVNGDNPDLAEPIDATPMDTENIENFAIDEPIVTEPIVPPAEVQKQPSPEPTGSNIVLHTEKSQLDLELDKMISDENKRKKLLAWSLVLDTCAAPKLSGDKDMIIDLDSNEVKPREKSGVEELQERFLKHAMKKPKADTQSSELSIFNTETGGLEKISHISESVVRSDPKPGQAYYKLKNEVGKKMGEKRREAMLKRIAEERQKRLEMESDDDEEEMVEYSDCGEEESGQEVDDGAEPAETGALNENGMEEDEEMLPGNELIDNEADEDGENENASSDESDDESDEEPATDANGTKMKRSRIIAAFEDDSGDEMPPPNDQTSATVMETSARSLDDSATNQSFGELPQIASTQMEDAKRQSIIDDMKEFESRLLDTNTQVDAPQPQSHSRSSTSALFPDEGDDGEIGESQLMALCSGAFVTQLPPTEVVEDETSNSAVAEIPEKDVTKNIPKIDFKAALLSSDDENSGGGRTSPEKKKKKSKKNKKKKLDYSDDEDDEGRAKGKASDVDGEEEEDEEGGEEEEMEVEDEEVDLGERFVEYDSDENEVEVTVTRKEMKKRASEFVEREAELSESEWGSADEDEKDLDAYDEKDLANEEDFDQRKLQSELERIRMRQQIDQDAREVRILKEMYIEDEEDIGQRERKFRWKNINDMDASAMQASADNDLTADNEEDENEEEWRRLRYEREQLLLKQTKQGGSADSPDTTATSESNQSGENATTTPNIVSSILRRTAIVKTATNSSNVSSPFLINQNAMMSAHVGRKSFLNRGEKTLEKLVNLTKASGDGETIKSSTASGKGFVFVATEKKFATKRKSDSDQSAADNSNNPSKKIKTNEAKKNEKSKPRLGFFQLLSK